MTGVQTCALPISGLPWGAASKYATTWFPDGANPFGEMHLAMLAAARRDASELRLGAARLQRWADRGHEAAIPALAWLAALEALLAGDEAGARTALAQCLTQCARLGGSHAQRTVIDELQSRPSLPAMP